jgi:hypothetical protein
MASTSTQIPSAKFTENGCVAVCCGCQQSFCIKGFIQHRLGLSKQMDNLQEEYEIFEENLNGNKVEREILSHTYEWEERSIRTIREIATKTRHDLLSLIDKTKSEIKISINKITTEFQSTSKSDNYTEIDINRWIQQLKELKNLLETPSMIVIEEDKQSSLSIPIIKIVKQEPSTIIPETTHQEFIKPIEENFVSIFGPCQLSQGNSVVTHSSYRAGLSQISGIHEYSFGKSSFEFLIEKKGKKNIFIGIHSSSNQISSQLTFDYSVHGWWNLDYIIINGESQGGNNNEIIQTGDRLTLIIDCDNQQIQLEHNRTKRIVHIPIELHVCPFPWKILIRLLNAGDRIRILRHDRRKLCFLDDEIS